MLIPSADNLASFSSLPPFPDRRQRLEDISYMAATRCRHQLPVQLRPNGGFHVVAGETAGSSVLSGPTRSWSVVAVPTQVVGNGMTSAGAGGRLAWQLCSMVAEDSSEVRPMLAIMVVARDGAKPRNRYLVTLLFSPSTWMTKHRANCQYRRRKRQQGQAR